MVNLDNLFKRIKDLKITAKKISEETGISSGNISDWKSGRSYPTAIKLDILADYLDCSVDYLLGRTDNPLLELKAESKCHMCDKTLEDANTLYHYNNLLLCFNCLENILVNTSVVRCDYCGCTTGSNQFGEVVDELFRYNGNIICLDCLQTILHKERLF